MEEVDEHPRTYLNADYVLDLEKEELPPGNILESIEGKFPGVRKEGDEFYARGQKLKLYMDGMPIDEELISLFSLQMFDKVEYIKSGISAGINYSGGILFFYAKRGLQNAKNPVETSGMKSVRIPGYSFTRHFYSPVYDGSEDKETTKEDYRSTLYWEPVIETNLNGKAQVSFYNGDQTGEIKIVVEGVTIDGELCRGTASYEVND
jgi:hypothetical protein